MFFYKAKKTKYKKNDLDCSELDHLWLKCSYFAVNMNVCPQFEHVQIEPCQRQRPVAVCCLFTCCCLLWNALYSLSIIYSFYYLTIFGIFLLLETEKKKVVYSCNWYSICIYYNKLKYSLNISENIKTYLR